MRTHIIKEEVVKELSERRKNLYIVKIGDFVRLDWKNISSINNNDFKYTVEKIKGCNDCDDFILCKGLLSLRNTRTNEKLSLKCYGYIKTINYKIVYTTPIILLHKRNFLEKVICDI